MVDTRDLKSRDSNIVRVRLPPAAPARSFTKTLRGIAQMARARGLGPRGRRFEPCFPDKEKRALKGSFFMTVSLNSAPLDLLL